METNINMKKLSHYELLDCFQEFPWEEMWKISPMLSSQDMVLYYYLAKSYYTGEGNIIDGGVLVGGTTVCFSQGLIQNKNHNKDRRLIIFDLFRDSTNGGNSKYLQGHYKSQDFIFGEDYVDFEKIFYNNIEQYKQYVNMIVHKGDLLNYQSYNYQEPIEILSIDVAKTSELMLHICHIFFPHLIPGKSLVILQDWVDIHLPFIHIAMNLLNEYFEDYYECPTGASKVFRCTKTITSEVINKVLGERVEDYYNLSNVKYISMSIESSVSLHNKAALEGVLAKFYFDMGQRKTAQQHFIDTIIKYDLSEDFITSYPFGEIYRYFQDVVEYYPSVYSRFKNILSAAEMQKLQSQTQDSPAGAEGLRSQIDTLQAQLLQAKNEAEQAEHLLEQAKNEAEQAKHLLEQAKNEAEQAKHLLEQAKNEAEQAEHSLEQSEGQLHQTQARLEQSKGQLHQTQARLEQSQTWITAMESSKFWKLRAKWFRVKTTLGIEKPENHGKLGW